MNKTISQLASNTASGAHGQATSNAAGSADSQAARDVQGDSAGQSDKVELLCLNSQEVHRLLDVSLILEAVREALVSEATGNLSLGPAAPMPTDSRGWLMAMPAALKDSGLAGVKWLGYYQREAADKTPTSWGNILILNSATSGLPYALLDCTEITAQRTAGGHALVAAQALANHQAKRLAVLGSGAQARAGILNFDATLDLQHITVYSCSAKHRQALVEELAGQLRASISAASSPEELTKDANLILTCSSATEPVVMAENIRPGATVLAVSAFHDLDPAITARADKWFLGNRSSDMSHIVSPPAFVEHLDSRKICGTLGEVLLSRVSGREHDKQIILYTHMGMGALDVAVGQKIYKRALAEGLGQKIRLA